jgi:hypothetical protein
LRRDPVGRESLARDAQRVRERDAEPRRLRVRLQAHRTTRLQGDRLIVKTDPQLMLNPQVPRAAAAGTPHGRSGQTQTEGHRASRR